MSGTRKLAIEVNFLTGRYVATAHNDRRRGEWPPHPARLFSALASTWADADQPDAEERQALEWIENQGAPAIAATSADPRNAVSHFVPVNDASIVSRRMQEQRARKVYEVMDLLRDRPGASGRRGSRHAAHLKKRLASSRDISSAVSHAGRTPTASALAMLPEGRGRQERFFPSVSPVTPRVTYIWDSCPGDETERVLDRLLERVTRLGHSSSLVACRVSPNPPEPTQVVATDGRGTSLRAVRSGQLAELERLQIRHQGVRPRSLPFADVRYRDTTAAPPDAVREPNTSGDWIVFECAHDSRSFPATRSVELATVMRAAILSYAEDPIPEAISGHRADGKPTLSPHVAIVPVPFAGFPYADGRIVGIAVSVPRGIGRSSRTALYRAIGIWERTVQERRQPPENYLTLTLGSRGVVRLRRVMGNPDLVSLQPRIWRRSSRRWVSVTPVALPRHPGGLTRGTARSRTRAWTRAEAAVRLACTHVDLPRPAAVVLSHDPWIAGARRAARFPAFGQAGPQGQPVRRQLLHVSLTFDEKVRGPLMLGAGRFVGLGLMRPVFANATPNPVAETADG